MHVSDLLISSSLETEELHHHIGEPHTFSTDILFHPHVSEIPAKHPSHFVHTVSQKSNMGRI